MNKSYIKQYRQLGTPFHSRVSFDALLENLRTRNRFHQVKRIVPKINIHDLLSSGNVCLYDAYLHHCFKLNKLSYFLIELK